MTRSIKLTVLLAMALGPWAISEARAAEAVSLTAAVQDGAISMTASGNGRDALTLVLINSTTRAAAVSVPAGSIASGATPDSRVVVVRASVAEVPPQGTTEILLPVTALSSKNPTAVQPFHFTPDAEPRLAALFTLLADQPDAPRPTVQLAVLATLENLHFSQWRQFLGATEAPPTPAEITQAIDALGLLKATAPDQNFALGNDSDLKLRALRNPWSRAKAGAIYGLETGDNAPPPDLRQLLHTQTGDNCPICRQRALMQKPADIP